MPFLKHTTTLIVTTILITFLQMPYAKADNESTIECSPTIDVFGTNKNNKLSTVNLSSTTVGYGPSNGYKDEITIINGNFHIATATSKATQNLSHLISSDMGAEFLVTSTPDSWKEFKVEENISGSSGIVDILAQQIKSNGCEQSVSVPFKITADAEQIKWSVVGRPSGASSVEANHKVTIVGIYSTLKSNGYFLPKNLAIHAHVNIPEKDITGHLRSIGTLKNITVYLPAK